MSRGHFRFDLAKNAFAVEDDLGPMFRSQDRHPHLVEDLARDVISGEDGDGLATGHSRDDERMLDQFRGHALTSIVRPRCQGKHVVDLVHVGVRYEDVPRVHQVIEQRHHSGMEIRKCFRMLFDSLFQIMLASEKVILSFC